MKQKNYTKKNEIRNPFEIRILFFVKIFCSDMHHVNGVLSMYVHVEHTKSNRKENVV